MTRTNTGQLVNTLAERASSDTLVASTGRRVDLSSVLAVQKQWLQISGRDPLPAR
jgi:hypothetical protein